MLIIKRGCEKAFPAEYLLNKQVSEKPFAFYVESPGKDGSVFQYPGDLVQALILIREGMKSSH